MTIENDCLAVLAQELGPAARAFLDRQCRGYLKKEPSALQQTDVELLAKCCASGIQPILGTQVAEIVRKNLLALQ